MLAPLYTNTFEKDLKRMIRRGKDPEKIKALIRHLIHEQPLSVQHRDHPLIGEYKGRRDCHVEPDWVLIYKKTKTEIIFERTGTHSDLFE